MFPMRFRAIFTSRWMALLWASGILWMAYDFVAPDEDMTAQSANQSTDAAGDPIDSKDAENVGELINQL